MITFVISDILKWKLEKLCVCFHLSPRLPFYNRLMVHNIHILLCMLLEDIHVFILHCLLVVSSPGRYAWQCRKQQFQSSLQGNRESY